MSMTQYTVYMVYTINGGDAESDSIQVVSWDATAAKNWAQTKLFKKLYDAGTISQPESLAFVSVHA